MTDRMEQMQAAAHSLRALTETTPEDRPSLAELRENLRSLRVIAESAGQLVNLTSGQIRGHQFDHAGGDVTSAKNPVEATGHAGNAQLALIQAQDMLFRAAAVIQMAEVSLNRIVPAAPTLEATLHVVPHDVDNCRFCANPEIRATVLNPDQGDHGWQCSACGWTTVDLGTMHEQVWTCSDGLDMVCPGCGAEGEFIDYPQDDPVDIAQVVADHLERQPAVRDALGGPGRVHVAGVEPRTVDLFEELDKMADPEDDEE